ncbi:hypothetical protein TNCV_1276561 [Trichonephila clavipes]|nr:hypothetical protein TNCV_1276561 [Trichonephila clavipes]
MKNFDPQDFGCNNSECKEISLNVIENDCSDGTDEWDWAVIVVIVDSVVQMLNYRDSPASCTKNPVFGKFYEPAKKKV